MDVDNFNTSKFIENDYLSKIGNELFVEILEWKSYKIRINYYKADELDNLYDLFVLSFSYFCVYC